MGGRGKRGNGGGATPAGVTSISGPFLIKQLEPRLATGSWINIWIICCQRPSLPAQRPQLHSWRRCEGLRRAADARPAARAAPPTSASAKASQALQRPCLSLPAGAEGRAGPGPWGEARPTGPPCRVTSGQPSPPVPWGQAGSLACCGLACGEPPALNDLAVLVTAILELRGECFVDAGFWCIHRLVPSPREHFHHSKKKPRTHEQSLHTLPPSSPWHSLMCPLPPRDQCIPHRMSHRSDGGIRPPGAVQSWPSTSQSSGPLLPSLSRQGRAEPRGALAAPVGNCSSWSTAGSSSPPSAMRPGVATPRAHMQPRPKPQCQPASSPHCPRSDTCYRGAQRHGSRAWAASHCPVLP